MKSGDPAGAGELRPLGFTARMQVEIADEMREQRLQRREIPKEEWRAAIGLHDPFDARHLKRTFEVAICPDGLAIITNSVTGGNRVENRVGLRRSSPSLGGDRAAAR